MTTTIPDAKAPVLAGIKCGNLYLGDKVANAGVLQVLQFLQQLTPEALQLSVKLPLMISRMLSCS